MKSNWLVYRHTSPSGKVYIGITTQTPKVRWQYGNGYKSCKLFYNTIIKYGWENIKHEILFSNIDEGRAKDLEINLIKHYKNLGISLNITDGGDGTLGMQWTPEMREKLRISKLGSKASESTKKRMREVRAGTNKGENNPMWGRTHSEETKRKMSISRRGPNNWRYGSHITEMERVKFREAQKTCKSVIQLDADNVIIKEFASIREAAKYIGAKPSHISECCRGIRNKVKNYKWKYKNG